MAIPPNLILGHNFNTDDFFLTYSRGNKKPTIIGTPALVFGRFIGYAVDLAVTVNDELNWSSTGLLAQLVQTGCVSCWMRPNYTGSPSADQVFYFSGAAATTNRVALIHLATGALEGHVYSSAGASIATISAAWAPTSGTWYNLELNFDVTAGASRMFVDGVQHGATNAGTGVRTNTSTLLNIGALPATAPINEFALDELLVWDAVQHTADFTPASSPQSMIHTYDPVTTGMVEN